MRRLLNRRLFGASLLASTGVLCVQRMRTSGRISDRRRPRSRVAILHADSYARSLEERVTDGLRLFGLELRGKNVLLKPNLVEYIPGAEVNTNPLLVDAAAGAFPRARREDRSCCGRTWQPARHVSGYRSNR